MENFVLNLFSDHLSKIILNYNDAKLKINANFLSGKGSINNLRLNVDLINQFLNRPPYGFVPYLQFTEITLSELRVEVTSYTNLKKAPVVLVIDEITARAVEPLEYYYDANKASAQSATIDNSRNNNNNNSNNNNSNNNKPSATNASTSYNLLHRILDNLAIKINRLTLTFQPLGKFKTRRAHPRRLWNPPPVVVCLENLEYISVTETGHPGTPEEVWSHNDLWAQHRARSQGNGAGRRRGQNGSWGQHRSYVIYKRLAMVCFVRLVPPEEEEQTGEEHQRQQSLESQQPPGAHDIQAQQQLQQQQQQQPMRQTRQLPPKNTQTATITNDIISNCQVDVHVAYVRRLRDAAVTGVDVDVFCHDVNIHLDASTPNNHGQDENRNSSTTHRSAKSTTSNHCQLRDFVHMLAGMQFCLYKDRSFTDPLLPTGVWLPQDQRPVPKIPSQRSLSKLPKETRDAATEQLTTQSTNGVEEETGPDAFLPGVAVVDDDLASSSDESDLEEEPDEEHDEAYLAWKREQEEKEGKIVVDDSSSVVAGEKEEEDPFAGLGANVQRDGNQFNGPPLDINLKTNDAISQGDGDLNPPTPKYKKKRKAVLVLASGAQKFENLSFSLNIQSVNAKLYLPTDDNSNTNSRHCFEFLMEGFVTECIWPKISGEIGGHVQCSLSYIQMMESVQQLRQDAVRPNHATRSGAPSSTYTWTAVEIHPIVRMGTKLFQGHDAFGLSPSWKGCWFHEDDEVVGVGGNAMAEGNICDDFPLMEDVDAPWKWTRPRGRRALALKSTVSFVDEKLTLWSKTNVTHEASISEVEIILNSSPLGRLAKLCLKSAETWYDKRWFTGEWSGEIHPGMISPDAVSNRAFHLKNYLQPLPAWFANGKMSALSSDLRSITARVGPVTIRVPNPLLSHNCFSMADVTLRMSEASMLVSSSLPKSFLSGTWISATESAFVDFPNSPTDPSCLPDPEGEDNLTKFRMQVKLRNVECRHRLFGRVVDDDANGLNSLLCPTNVTMMMSLEHRENIVDGSSELNLPAQAIQSLVISVLIPHVVTNLEPFSLYGALETIRHHAFGGIEGGDSNSKAEDARSVCPMTQPITQIDGVSGPKEQPTIPYRKVCVVCVHLPHTEVNLWGYVHDKSAEHSLLSRLVMKAVELGFESFTTDGRDSDISKICLGSLCVEVCKQAVLSSEMTEILSLGKEGALMNDVCGLCSCDKRELDESDGLMIRIDHGFDNSYSKTAHSGEITAPLTMSLDTSVWDHFFDVAATSLSKPVFVLKSSTIVPQSVGRAALASMAQLASVFFSSPTSDTEKFEQIDRRTEFLTRLFLSRLFVILPRPDSRSNFGLLFRDFEAAIGHYHFLDSTLRSHSLADSYCGKGYKTWRSSFDTETVGDDSNFYVLKSNQTILSISLPSIASTDELSHQMSIIVPSFDVELSSLFKKYVKFSDEGPTLDAGIMADLLKSLSCVGMSFFSLIQASPDSSGVSSSSTSSALKSLAESLEKYHSKFLHSIDSLHNEVESLRRGIFMKERERVGALALASSDASGWVRVGEGSSFSHRIFSSATLWKYWMVLSGPLLILYRYPGCVNPSFVIPLSTSTELRGVVISSAASKISTGIVGNHLQQRGFAIVEPVDGTELFFIASDEAEYNKWVSKLSRVLKRGEPASSSAHAIETQDVPIDAHPLVNSKMETEIVPEPLEDIDSLVFEAEAIQPTDDFTKQVSDGVQPIPPVEKTEDFVDELMETISLSDSIKVVDDTITTQCSDEAPASINTPPISMQSIHDVHEQQLIQQSPAGPANPRSLSEQAFNKSTSLMRDRFTKGKSRFANTGNAKNAKAMFGSALKSAKSGVLAAGELGREGLKQALEKEDQLFHSNHHNNVPKQSKATASRPGIERPVAVGQKVAVLKQKLGTVVRTSPHEQPPIASDNFRQSSLSKSDTKDDQTENTQEQSSFKQPEIVSNHGENELLLPFNVDQADMSNSQRSGKQEFRKKFDQSMSNTIRRLKIDEKMTQISAAVKTGQSMRSFSVSNQQSKPGELSRRRAGIGDELKSTKSIKFDARETFSSYSELPTKIKSIRSGDILSVIGNVRSKYGIEPPEFYHQMNRIEGTWAVSVNAIKSTPIALSTLQRDLSVDEVDGLSNEALKSQMTRNVTPSEERHELKYEIRCTGVVTQESSAFVQKSVSEILLFHTRISEIIARNQSCFNDAQISCTEKNEDLTLNVLPLLDQLKVSGMLLQSILDSNSCGDHASKPPVRDHHCEVIKTFIYALLESYLPEEAVSATEGFLRLKENVHAGIVQESVLNHHDSNFTMRPTMAMSQVPIDTGAIGNNPLPFDLDGALNTSFLQTILDGYTNAMKEKNEALASLATASTLHNHRTIRWNMSKHRAPVQSTQNIPNNEDDMLMLCKQLGNEISLRTSAEQEIRRLNGCLEFERKLALAKEQELRAELARCRSELGK